MSLWHDLRFAVRLLVKDKWFTAVAALALAQGIGVNATVFTFVNAVLIRGLPFDDPDRIMSVASPQHGARTRLRHFLPGFQGTARHEHVHGPCRVFRQHDERERRRETAGAISRSLAFRAAALAVPCVRIDVRDLRGHCTCALGGRPLRRDGVFGRATHAGDRRQDGARRAGESGVWWLILRRSLVQLAIGLVIGLAGALGVGKILESLLVQTSNRDPATLVTIAALMIFVSLSRVLLAGPARHAARPGQGAARRAHCTATWLAKGGKQAFQPYAIGRGR